MASPHPLEFINMIENVDPALKEDLSKALTPQGTSKVAASPNFTFIVCNYLRGLTVGEICTLLENDKKEFIPANTIRDYMLQYVPARLQRPNLIYKYYEQQPNLDEIGILEQVLKIQMERVTARAGTKAANLEEEESTRREIELLHKMAYNTIEAKIKTGRTIEAPKKVEITHHGEVKQTNSTTVEVIDSRTASAALQFLADLKNLPTKKAEIIEQPEPDEPINH